MSKPTALLAGGYGYGNVGDDAIALAICNLLSEAAPNMEVVLLGGPPARLREIVGVSGHHLGWRSPLATAGLLRLVRASSVVLIGGGGILQDTLPNFYRPFCLLALSAKMLRKPVMFYAAGVQPPQTLAYRELARRALSGADVITVRDTFSAESVAELGVLDRAVVMADPAITLGPPARWPRAKRGRQPLIGVSLRPWRALDRPGSGYAGELARTAAQCLDTIVAATGAGLRFIPMHFGGDDDDAIFQQQVIRYVGVATTIEVVANQRPLDALAAIGQCDLMLGMRLHANVLAAAAGVPSIALRYDPKVGEFMRQLGAGNRVLDIDALEPQQVAEQVVALLGDRERAAAAIRERIQPLIASARACAQTAVELAGLTPEKVPASVAPIGVEM